MAKQAVSVDSAGLKGARTYASERLSSVSSVRISASKGEMTITTRGGQFVASHEGRGGNVGKDKTLHKK